MLKNSIIGLFLISATDLNAKRFIWFQSFY